MYFSMYFSLQNLKILEITLSITRTRVMRRAWRNKVNNSMRRERSTVEVAFKYFSDFCSVFASPIIQAFRAYTYVHTPRISQRDNARARDCAIFMFMFARSVASALDLRAEKRKTTKRKEKTRMHARVGGRDRRL